MTGLSSSPPGGAALEAWGTPGSGEGEFEFDCSGITYGGVVFAADGGFSVADSGNQRIQQFAPDRTLRRSWSGQGGVDSQLLVTARGNRASEPARDSCPVSLAVDQQGRVIVSDRAAGEIQVFAADGRSLLTATEKGMRPEGVAIDSGGNIWVADNGNRVLQFSPEGTLLTTWGRSGRNDGEFITPMSIAVDGQGRVYKFRLLAPFGP